MINLPFRKTYACVGRLVKYFSSTLACFEYHARCSQSIVLCTLHSQRCVMHAAVKAFCSQSLVPCRLQLKYCIVVYTSVAPCLLQSKYCSMHVAFTALRYARCSQSAALCSLQQHCQCTIFFLLKTLTSLCRPPVF